LSLAEVALKSFTLGWVADLIIGLGYSVFEVALGLLAVDFAV